MLFNDIERSTLFAAIENNQIENIKILLNKGVRLVRNDETFFLLFKLIKEKRMESLQLLLDAHLDLNQKNKAGEGLLHVAVQQNDLDAFTTLVALGASLSLTNHKGQTPFHLLSLDLEQKWINHPVIRKLLTKERINLQDHDGNTFLHALMQYFIYPTANEIEFAEYLLAKGGSLSIRNREGHTPLSLLYQHLLLLPSTLQADKIAYLNRQTRLDCFTITQAKLDQFDKAHQLFVVFGGQKLIDRLGSRNEFFAGGEREDGQKILVKALTAFYKRYPHQKELEKIADLFIKNYEPISRVPIYYNFLAQQILKGRALLTTSGSKTHSIGVMLEKIDNEVILTFSERGVWSSTPSFNTKVNAIQTLKFKANFNIIKEVLACLSLAKELHTKEAWHILFQQIPTMTKSNFIKKNAKGRIIWSEPYKIGLCYLANLKTLLHNLFDIYLNDGKLWYKHFDIFFRKAALENYKTSIPEGSQNKDLIFICNELIKEKEKKIASLDEHVSNKVNVHDREKTSLLI